MFRNDQRITSHDGMSCLKVMILLDLNMMMIYFFIQEHLASQPKEEVEEETNTEVVHEANDWGTMRF